MQSLVSEIALHFLFQFWNSQLNKFLICKCIFYEGIKVNSKRFFGSLPQNFLLCEDGSVCSSPPDTNLTGNCCVCVRQNVAKRHDFSKIFNILTFHWYFANMLTTCTTKYQGSMLATHVDTIEIIWYMMKYANHGHIPYGYPL